MIKVTYIDHMGSDLSVVNAARVSFGKKSEALGTSGVLPLPAAVAAVLGANIGTTGTIWLAGLLVSDGMPRGDTLRIAMIHTGVNLLMALSLLPFVNHIAKYVGRVG